MSQTARVGGILVVEDPFVRIFLKSLLERHGYKVLEAERGRAFDLLNSPVPEVDLLITNEPQYFESVARDVPLLYLAAAPDPDVVAGFRHCRVLAKPFLPKHLLTVVQELVAAPAGTRLH